MAKVEKRRTIIKTDGDSRSYQKSIKGAEKSNRSFSDTLSKMSLALTAAFAGLTAGLGKALKAYSEQERSQRVLQNALKNSGRDVEQTTEQLNKLSAEFQKLTTVGDETSNVLFSILARNVNLTTEAIGRATLVAINMAEAMGQDVTSATTQLAQALESPIDGMTRLRRQGIFFTEEEKERVKVLLDSGRQAEAQNVILGKLEDRYKGVAEAIAKTPLGIIKQVGNEFGDLLEVVGKTVAEAIKPFAESLRDTLREFKQNEEAIQSTARALVELTKFIGVFLGVTLGVKGITAVTLAVKGLTTAFTVGRVSARAFWATSTLGVSLLITEMPTLLGWIDRVVEGFKKIKPENFGVDEFGEAGAGFVTADGQPVASSNSNIGPIQQEKKQNETRSAPIALISQAETQTTEGISARNSDTATFQALFNPQISELQQAQIEYNKKLIEERQKALDEVEKIEQEKEEENKERILRKLEAQKEADKEALELALKNAEEESKLEEEKYKLKIQYATKTTRNVAEIFKSGLLFQISRLVETVPAMFIGMSSAQGGLFGFLAALAQVTSVVAPLINAISSLSRSNPVEAIPTFHTGGMVRGVGGTGETLAKLQEGETVFTKDDTHQLIKKLSNTPTVVKMEVSGGDDLVRALQFKQSMESEEESESVLT